VSGGGALKSSTVTGTVTVNGDVGVRGLRELASLSIPPIELVQGGPGERRIVELGTRSMSGLSESDEGATAAGVSTTYGSTAITNLVAMGAPVGAPVEPGVGTARLPVPGTSTASFSSRFN